MSVIALKCPHLDVVVVDADPENKAWNGPLNSLPVYDRTIDIVKKARGRNLFFQTIYQVTFKV